MRTRRSARVKATPVQSVDYGVSSDDDERPKRKRRGRSEDDENFALAGQRDDEGDKKGNYDEGEIADRSISRRQGGSAGDDEDDGRSYAGSVPSTPAGTPGRRVLAPRTRKKPGKPRGESDSIHRIPPYPVEVKSTRTYAGPLKRHDRFGLLVDVMYGPDDADIDRANDMRHRWVSHPVLPGKVASRDDGPLESPWVTDEGRAEILARARAWYRSLKAEDNGPQRVHALPFKHTKSLLPQADGDLVAFLGPHNEQKQYTIKSGECLSLQTSGTVIESPEETPSEWMFEVGGIPLAMGWAPMAESDQILALAVIPESDQAYYATDEDEPESDKTKGSIQFWVFAVDRGGDTPALSLRQQPRMIYAACFDWGRPTRLQWCPVPFDPASSCGLLAVLSGDGQVRVIEVKHLDSHQPPACDWVDAPIAVLGLTAEYSVRATCFSWVNANRIVLGHSDGSITLWSIYPQCLLQRHAVQPTCVLDICSGYPSAPYLIASTPVGGCTTITDLTRPSAETTYVASPGINFQPNMLAWSEHMQGFAGIYPNSGVGSTVLAFLHARYFPLPRSLFTGSSLPVCISMGAVHPFLLVGCADGSLLSCNAIRKVFFVRDETLKKIRIFEHEYRPAPSDRPAGLPKVRGAIRILQNFVPELNDNPRTEHQKQHNMQKRVQKAKDKKQNGMAKSPAGRAYAVGDLNLEEDDDASAAAATAAAADGEPYDPRRVVIHEPLTRVTAVAWNPNIKFGCWAATAMGSGLVRVLDLGID